MNVRNFLSPDDSLVEVRASDKARLLRDLANRAAAKLGLDGERVARDIIKREGLGSTGIGRGVAIPHARIEGLGRPVGILAQLRSPIAFDAIDDKPVDIVFLLLLPAASGGEQLNALACAARALREPDSLRALRAARDAAALYLAVTAAGAKPEQASGE